MNIRERMRIHSLMLKIKWLYVCETCEGSFISLNSKFFVRINSDLFVLLKHARTDLEIHSIHANTWLFRYGRNATGGKCLSVRFGELCQKEIRADSARGISTSVCLSRRWLAIYITFFPTTEVVSEKYALKNKVVSRGYR